MRPRMPWNYLLILFSSTVCSLEVEIDSCVINIVDYQAATLYGQTTFGKGTMQTLFYVSPENPEESDILKLTTGEFFSPKGNKINGVGVTPDIFTEKGDELIRAHQDALNSMTSTCI